MNIKWSQMVYDVLGVFGFFFILFGVSLAPYHVQSFLDSDNYCIQKEPNYYDNATIDIKKPEYVTILPGCPTEAVKLSFLFWALFIFVAMILIKLGMRYIEVSEDKGDNDESAS